MNKETCLKDFECINQFYSLKISIDNSFINVALLKSASKTRKVSHSY